MCKDKIAVVLVTFNRLDKLKQAVEYYEQQTYPIQEVVIVDNHSTDGTIQYLKEWVNGKGNFKRKTVLLNHPWQGLLIDTNVWRTLDDFSSGAVCMVLASEHYEEEDYIYDYDEFLAYVHHHPTTK